ncbi:alpha-glucosidase/alpha-galactosidase [Cohnella fermenti]|uniref:Alpha-glucosidase/alpha-galactosidase n=1 Tax=Cohnella fermenti TaxID=2565925 RepID=A0A4S4BR56_9BACL|nr:alpha-glucosidase/alpha-galactosidase [Cohnella fermenti]THF77300.1 alpha-glucosidase/alpha-galactosidase [Cohnella fermenti]
MSKITFLGAGSTVFAKNVLGDVMMTPSLQEFELALFDIDSARLKDSENMLNNLSKTSGSRCRVVAYSDRKEALRGAKYVVNAIQVGGYEPSTVIDFEVPKKYGLRQTIADTLGIGGIFRNLRTIPVMLDFARDIREVCPDAWFLNYTNPMAVLTNVMNTHGGVKTVGLCHSVQVCVSHLFKDLGLDDTGVQSKIAGINHMAWLLEVKKDGVDLYPEIKRRAAERQKEKHHDMVRYELMNRFGHYVTESSEHNAEYHPYFIKRNYPELIERFNIPLDEYPRRCVNQIEGWAKMRDSMVNNESLTHERSHEYASYIFDAMETNTPFKIGGNVMNTGGLIANLPREACVEVPCLVDASGVTPTYVGNLPPQLAALNRTNINTQLLTIEAAITGKKEHIYHAALLDPHTAAELSIDDIVSLCDDLIEAHGNWLPAFK